MLNKFQTNLSRVFSGMRFHLRFQKYCHSDQSARDKTLVLSGDLKIPTQGFTVEGRQVCNWNGGVEG